MFSKPTTAMIFAALLAAPISAQAAPLLDGSGFGAASAVVTYDPTAPSGNFGTPGTTTSGAAYSISVRTDGTYDYVLVSQTGGGGTAPGIFANLYFGTGVSAFSGSDVGFEVNNSDVFVPGASTTTPTAGTGIAFADLNSGTEIEFAVPVSYFETDPQGIGFDKVTAANPDVVLRLSQSFGYSVAGGASYGTDRLGLFVASFAGAVPEPASWIMMIVGFGLAGAGLRRRKPSATAALA